MEKPSTPDFHCFEYEGDFYCPDARSPSPFNETQKIYQAMNQNQKEVLSLDSYNQKNNLECFSLNISSAWVFTIFFLLATILINAFHELGHFLVLLFSDEVATGFMFNISGGVTNLPTIPIENHSCWWWLLLLLVPLLIINTGSILVITAIYSLDRSSLLLFERIPSQTSKFTIFLKSIGYVSSITILMNTLFAPITEYMYMWFGFEVQSDFLLLWKLSWTMPEHIIVDFGSWFITDVAIMQVSVLVIVAWMSYIAFRYLLGVGKRIY